MWTAARKGQDGKVKREARSTDSRDGKISTRVARRKRVAANSSLVSDSQLMAMKKNSSYFVPKFLPTLSTTYVQE